ncbi:MAG: Crp/Fnr family transcriptional regulator [Spirillospora sp.]
MSNENGATPYGPHSHGPHSYGPHSYGPHSLLAALSEDERQVLLSLGRLREYEPGDLLLNEGDTAMFVAIVLDGAVKIMGVTETGRTSLLAVRTAGDIVGELGVLDGAPRVATAIAAGLVRARVIASAQFKDCLLRHPSINAATTRTVVEKLRSATRRRIDLGGREAKVRLARVLLELHADGGEVLLTQTEMSELIGSSEPTVHKALRTLREQGVVDTRYRRLVIVDLARLREIADLPGD